MSDVDNQVDVLQRKLQVKTRARKISRHFPPVLGHNRSAETQTHWQPRSH